MFPRWLIFLLLCLLPSLCLGEVIIGRCIGVYDGDSLTLESADKGIIKVRLHGIDAPELAQQYGKQSRDTLRKLVLNRELLIRCHGKDRYKRHLGEVYCGSLHINTEMLRCGMAWHYRQYDKSKTYAEATHAAQRVKRGIFAQSSLPPWEYRALLRKKRKKID